jgi:hypothetical protein
VARPIAGDTHLVLPHYLLSRYRQCHTRRFVDQGFDLGKLGHCDNILSCKRFYVGQVPNAFAI